MVNFLRRLELNVDKSEVGWLGPKKELTLLPSTIRKKIDLHHEEIRILGLFMSHDQNYRRINNVERVFKKFKSILDIWKERNLTLYGKSVVVNSLALTQLRFAFSNFTFPENYVRKVQDEIVKFIYGEEKKQRLNI